MTAVWLCDKCQHKYYTSDDHLSPFPRMVCATTSCECQCESYVFDEYLTQPNIKETQS